MQWYIGVSSERLPGFWNFGFPSLVFKVEQMFTKRILVIVCVFFSPYFINAHLHIDETTQKSIHDVIMCVWMHQEILLCDAQVYKHASAKLHTKVWVHQIAFFAVFALCNMMYTSALRESVLKATGNKQQDSVLEF